MKIWSSILAASLVALASSTAAYAARTDIVVGVVLEPPHLDPTGGAAAAIDEVVYANVFEGLTRIDEKGQPQPGLAESWTASEDGKQYTFKLRSGVKFHDGSDFDANDVKFSLDRARAEDSTNAQKKLFQQITDVTVVDPTTVKITLANPQGLFVYNMGLGDAVIVAPESADTNKEKPVGTGPFKFDSWSKGSAIRLSKAEGYWGDPVFLDKVEFRVIPDAAAAVPALLSGDVQAFPNAPVGDALAQIEADTRLKVVIGATEGETILSMNNKKAPFDKLEVRQAVASAIDRNSVIDAASNGFGLPIGSHVSPNNPDYVDLVNTYPYDVAKAKEYLKAAGLADGFKATIKLPPVPYARQGGEVIAAQLRDVGINLDIIPVEWADWLKGVYTDHDFDFSIVSHTEANDIDIYARPNYYIGYDNADFNKWAGEWQIANDAAKRKELFGEMQKKLATDVPVVFLFELPKVGVWDAKVEGLWENSPIQANDMTKVKWAD
ncbi:MAG: ABC transporter substrate-binding protein [Mesorhizobium sp.]